MWPQKSNIFTLGPLEKKFINPCVMKPLTHYPSGGKTPSDITCVIAEYGPDDCFISWHYVIFAYLFLQEKFLIVVVVETRHFTEESKDSGKFLWLELVVRPLVQEIELSGQDLG